MNNKKLIRLTEADLHRIVKESVNKILNESSVATRGTRTNSGGVYSSPFDDEENGSTTWTDAGEENKYIEKYAQAIADRIEKALKRNGVENCHVDVHEDVDYDEQYNNTTRELVFDIEWGGVGLVKPSKVYLLVCKILGNMEMVRYFNIKTNASGAMNCGDLQVTAVVEADKNGMDEIPKEPYYRVNDYTSRQGYSHFKA